MKRSHQLVMATIIMVGLLGATLIGTVSASDTAEVYVYPAARAGPYTSGTVLTYQVRIGTASGQGAPHETSEPAVATDKTWAWEVVILYDPSVISVEISGTAPYRHSTMDWFDYFHKWWYDPDMMEWEDLGPYGNFFAGAADDSKGEVAATCTMTEDITTELIPEDDMGDPSFPQGGLHVGSYMDLPYSDGLGVSYICLFVFKVYLLENVGAGETVEGTTLHISEASFFQYDKVTKYTVNTTDATIGSVVPEFPLGLGLLMTTVLAIPIVYLWRTRKKVRG